ncbi:response regulator [candidate division KSB1 bacterium]
MEKNKTEKILVADDDPVVRKLLNDLLKLEYSDIDVVENGEQACRKLLEKKYDLVLTDIKMPDTDGMQVLRKAKELYDDIIVLIMTGRATLETAIEAVNLGAKEYINKPFDVNKLLKVIKTHLDKQKHDREELLIQRQTLLDRDKLKKSLLELSILHNFTTKLTYNFDLSEVYSSILDSITQAVENDFCSIFEIKKNIVRIKASVKMEEKVIDRLKLNFIKSVYKECGMSINPAETKIIIDEIPGSGRKTEEIGTTFYNFLKVRDDYHGVLNVSRFNLIEFSPDDQGFLIKLAEQSTAIFSQLQEVIESQKDKMQKLIEDIPDGIIFHDRNDDALLVNPAARNLIIDAGLSIIDLKNIEGLFEIHFDELYSEEVTDESFIREFKIPGMDNKILILDANVAKILDPDDLPQGILMVLRDVTKERELERLKSEVISNVSHELRTPAAVIKEFISIINDGIAGPTSEEQKEYLRIMASNTERLLRLIDNLLNMSRMEAGIIKLRKSEFNLNDLLDTVIKSLLIRFKDKNIVLNYKVADGLPIVYADKDAVSQIVVNLLDNARKFSNADSEVFFKADVSNGNINFEVRDSGIGIPQKDLKNIFNRFYRVEDDEMAHREGSGLGLAIVKEFIELHEGTVKVNTKLKKGTTFFVSIPAQRNEE